MEPITFKMPGGLQTYKYAVDNNDEYPYPMTVLLLGTNGDLMPCLVLDWKWAKETYLHDLPPLKLKAKEEEKKSSLPMAKLFTFTDQGKAPVDKPQGLSAIQQ